MLLSDETVFEMKAQALVSLHEWIPAITAVKKCIELRPNWWVTSDKMTYDIIHRGTML